VPVWNFMYTAFSTRKHPRYILLLFFFHINSDFIIMIDWAMIFCAYICINISVNYRGIYWRHDLEGKERHVDNKIVSLFSWAKASGVTTWRLCVGGSKESNMWRIRRENVLFFKNCVLFRYMKTYNFKTGTCLIA
jgi:hypothetical protein